MADYELAKAYVQIIPTTKGIGNNVETELEGIGIAGGKSAGNGILSGLKSPLAAVGKVTAAGLAAATGGLVAFGKSAVGAGSEFDAAMSQVMATMGYSVADLQTEGSIAQQTMQKLRDFAQEQGATTAFSALGAAALRVVFFSAATSLVSAAAFLVVFFSAIMLKKLILLKLISQFGCKISAFLLFKWLISNYFFQRSGYS